MPNSAAPLYALNKPYGVLSQFTPRDGNPGLASLMSLPGYRPIGRLDHDSEGLLLLTNDKHWIARLASASARVGKRYVVQVEGEPGEEALEALRKGPRLSDGPTRTTQVRAIPEPAWLWPRTPPIRQRRRIPTGWLEMQITEGRNRQVRRMTAAVGLPTLRLIRVAVGPFELGALRPGELRAVAHEELQHRLR